MTDAPTLNTLASTHGAVMVSGTLWTTHSYTPDGLFSAKYSSGPLILWAKSGEGESLPTLQPPTLSALEEQTAKLNTRATFERLFWAARGKVRASVRWKTARKVWRRGPLRRNDEEVNRLLCIRRILGYKDEAKDYHKVCLLFGGLGHNLTKWMREAPNLRDERPMSTYLWYLIRKAMRHPTNLASGLTAYLGEEKGLISILFLKHLEASAYRAYLAKRVKPVKRPTRAPRPLCARPRPPTAPTAPPLLEA